MTNRIHKAFDGVTASPAQKEAVAQYLRAQREKRRPRLAVPSAALAFCAALLISFGLWRYLAAPVSYVSIDVNPSVELALNRLDRVVSAKAYNDDGQKILQNVSLRGVPYLEAIEQLLNSSAMEPYLTDSADLTFTVAASAAEKQSSLLSGIESCPGYRQFGGQECSADIDRLEEAHSHGLSLGKYTAFLALSEYESAITPEDCHSMTMAQLHNRIRAHEHGQSGEHHAEPEEAQSSGDPEISQSEASDVSPCQSQKQAEHSQSGHGNGHGAHHEE